MPEETFIVTGGNAGIGKAVATALARGGARVVLVSRDPERGEAAVAEIRSSAGSDQVQLEVGDLGTIAGCRQLGRQLLSRYPRIHVLINNAGVWMTEPVLNADGLETSFMVNHMAPFILSNMLLERLADNAPARIVNVSAGLYVKGRVDLEKTPWGHDFSRFGTYANTKLCNVLATCELARRLEGTGVTVNAVHPGVVRTGLGDTGGALGTLLKFAKRFWRTPEEGARAPVWLATDPALDNVNGRFFDQLKEVPLSETARDVELARRLWVLTARLADAEPKSTHPEAGT